MFVTDYEPAKKVGAAELDGALLMLRDRIDEKRENGEADAALYEGAWAALYVLRCGRFNYPRDFMTVLENELRMLGDGLWGVYNEGGE